MCAARIGALRGLSPAGAAGSRTQLALMRWIDEQYLATPFYGSRRMTAELRRASHRINRKRVQRLMRLMGLEALGPKPKTSRPSAQRRHYVANGLDFGADAGNRGGSAPL